MEVTKTEQKKEKIIFKMRIVYETSGATSSIITFALYGCQKKKREKSVKELV